MDSKLLKGFFETHKELSLSGRYIYLDLITPLLEKLQKKIKVAKIGESENQAPIHLATLGNGPRKLLFWSQMHGNESTTTKAIFDLINFLLDDKDPIAQAILEGCTLYIVPMLSPDGAKAYTRVNYNKVDLNRDAQNKTQKESVALSQLSHKIKPDVAFNLHGQRTIFSAGPTNHPATMSFLSPAGDAERSITPSRKVAMELIAGMNKVLQQCIPNQVGRYDDGFNINCVGDTLANMGIPTILFEAGHFPDDYDREVTREYVFYSLVTSLHYITKNELSGNGYKDYFLIPENDKCFYDIIIRNVLLAGKKVDIGVLYREVLLGDIVKFVPKVAKIGNLRKFYGHSEIKGEKRTICNENDTVQIVPEVELLNFYLDSELFSVELVKS